jgi:hypothetical protein
MRRLMFFGALVWVAGSSSGVSAREHHHHHSSHHRSSHHRSHEATPAADQVAKAGPGAQPAPAETAQAAPSVQSAQQVQLMAVAQADDDEIPGTKRRK